VVSSHTVAMAKKTLQLYYYSLFQRHYSHESDDQNAIIKLESNIMSTMN